MNDGDFEKAEGRVGGILGRCAEEFWRISNGAPEWTLAKVLLSEPGEKFETQKRGGRRVVGCMEGILANPTPALRG